MQTITATDAVLKSAEDLKMALGGELPQNCTTKTAIDLLMKIFKQKSKATSQEDVATPQRVQVAGPQRVVREKNKTHIDQSLEQEHRRRRINDVMQENKNENTTIKNDTKASALIDNNEAGIERQNETKQDGPDFNTRSKTRVRSLTQEVALQAIEISGRGAKLTARSTAARKYPLEFLCEYANAVLDGETGELLQYRHLIKSPKYKKDWFISAGNEVGRLAQGMPSRDIKGTDTLFFIQKSEVPSDRWKDITYAQFVCDVRPQKKEKNHARLVAGGIE